MRFAFVTSQAFTLINFRGPLISKLIAEGIVVFALAPDYDKQSRESIYALGATPIDCALSRTGINPFVDIINTFKLALTLAQANLDVVLCYSTKPVIFGTIAAFLARVPKRIAMIEGLGFVYTANSEKLTIIRMLLKNIVSLLYRFALSLADKVIFLNDDDINDFLKSNLVSVKKVIKLGGIGVDLDEWKPTPLPLNPVTFVLAARLLREKGIVEYAEAAKKVKNKYPSTRFLLLGSLDKNPGSLSESEVLTWVSQDIIEWPGQVSVKDWYSKASVFVLPSYREGVPRSTQEAMAMGRPVITTLVPGCKDTVVEGVNGFLVLPRDADALANVMIKFVEQPDLIEKMGAASHVLANSRFDVHKINSTLLSIIFK